MSDRRVIKAGRQALPPDWTVFRPAAGPGPAAPDDRSAPPAPTPQPAEPSRPDPVAVAAAEAEALLAAARAEAERLRADAFVAGREEGLAAGRAEVAEVLAEARRVLDEAWEERRSIVEGALDDAVELALGLARQVLARELQSSPDEVVELARRLLREAPEGPVVLRAHPADAANLEGQRELLGGEARVREDAGLCVGDLVVETTTGTLEATLAGRIERLEAVVREVAARAD